MPEAIAPSIPGELVPGKDPPEDAHAQEKEREDNTAAGVVIKRDKNADERAMPPPPNPRRSGPTNPDLPPQSPNILLTQPTFTGSLSQNQTPQTPIQARHQRDMLGEGLAGTEATVKERPPFAPFFTLVNDVASGSTYHPAQVHYLFSDDDASEALTGALVRCCGAEHLLGDEGNGRRGQSAEGDVSSGSGISAPVVKKEKKRRSGEKDKLGRKGQKEREERVVIVDVNDSGDGIKGVWSANPSWAVLGAEIANAPTWDGAEPEDGGPERGLMLRIEGIGVGETIGDEVGSLGKGKRDSEGRRDSAETASGIIGEDEMQSLLEGFDRKMSVLRRIAVSGEEFRKSKEEPAKMESRRVERHDRTSIQDPMAESG